tara:strand:- start:1615 stop:1800 length:186 start_codon:yes stop_codon:yes gene_type:complete
VVPNETIIKFRSKINPTGKHFLDIIIVKCILVVTPLLPLRNILILKRSENGKKIRNCENGI